MKESGASLFLILTIIALVLIPLNVYAQEEYDDLPEGWEAWSDEEWNVYFDNLEEEIDMGYPEDELEEIEEFIENEELVGHEQELSAQEQRDAMYSTLLSKKWAFFNRTTDKKYPFYLDTFKIITIINNTGWRPFVDLNMTQELPKNVEKASDLYVIKRKGKRTAEQVILGSQHTDSIYWWGLVQPKETIFLEQEVIVTESDPRVEIIIPKTYLDYRYKTLPYNTSRPEKKLKIGDPLGMRITPQKEYINYGDRMQYSIKLWNNHKREDLQVTNLTIFIPSKTRLFSKSGELKEGKVKKRTPCIEKRSYDCEVTPTTLQWSGNIAKKKSVKFMIELEHFGIENVIKIASEHEYGELKMKKTKEHNTPVEVKDLIFEVKTDEVTYEGTQTVEAAFFIENTNPNVPFQNVKINFDSEFFHEETKLFNIAPRERKRVKTVIFDLPDVTQETRKQLIMSGTYETPQFDILEFKKIELLEIQPRPGMQETILTPETTPQSTTRTDDSSMTTTPKDETGKTSTMKTSERKKATVTFEEEKEPSILLPTLAKFIAVLVVLSFGIRFLRKRRDQVWKKRAKEKEPKRVFKNDIEEEVYKVLEKIRK